MQRKAIHTFNPSVLVADNRILSYSGAIENASNPHLWVHPGDLTSERQPALEQKLRAQMTLEYPPIHEDPIVGAFTESVKAIMPRNPLASNEVYIDPAHTPLPSDPFKEPFSHYANGEPFPPYSTDADMQASRDALTVYLVVNDYLDKAGRWDILKQVQQDALKNKTVPSAQDFFDAMQPLTGVSGADAVGLISTQGARGVLEGFDVPQSTINEYQTVTQFIMNRGFSLNDLTNWSFGRTQPELVNAPIEKVIGVGKDVRIQQTIEASRELGPVGELLPTDRVREHQVASVFNMLPPVLSELFFESDGMIVFTESPNLKDVLGVEATGYHINYDSPNPPYHSMRQVYVSQELGLPASNRTIVHEVNHTMFPEQITWQEAEHGDNLLEQDRLRILELKALTEKYASGNGQDQLDVLSELNSRFAVDGMSFTQMMGDTNMQTFIGAVHEAYHYLQMDSPTYDRIDVYREPIARFKEIIPRYAEMAQVEHVDHPGMMQFMVPGITEIYNEIYIPHLHRELEKLHTVQGSKMQSLLYASELNPELYAEITSQDVAEVTEEVVNPLPDEQSKTITVNDNITLERMSDAARNMPWVEHYNNVTEIIHPNRAEPPARELYGPSPMDSAVPQFKVDARTASREDALSLASDVVGMSL